jgi:hypothetical protein
LVTVDAALRRRATLIVRESGTPLIGISGRPIGLLDRSDEVVVHDEVGPYTVVSFDGRNGYVLTEALQSQARVTQEVAAIFDEALAGEAGHPSSTKRLAVLTLSALALLASTGIGTVLALG